MQVFYTSPWVPPEWIAAHGFEPRGAWTELARNVDAVPEGTCAFSREVLEFAAARPGSPIIFTTACDQLRRAFDAATRHRDGVFLFNLPATWQSAAARRLYVEEMGRLGRFLVQLGGIPPTREKLTKQVSSYGERRMRLKRELERVSGKRAAQLLAGIFSGNTDSATEMDSEGDSETSAVPVAIVGGPLLPHQWGVFDMLRSAGARVVLNATEPGERCLLSQAREPGEAAISMEALADLYFDNIIDVFQRPNTRLYDWLRVMLARRNVAGIILWVHVCCDLWRAEATSLREAFGLPVLLLEAHDQAAARASAATRVSAFLEALREAPAVRQTAPARGQSAWPHA